MAHRRSPICSPRSRHSGRVRCCWCLRWRMLGVAACCRPNVFCWPGWCRPGSSSSCSRPNCRITCCRSIRHWHCWREPPSPRAPAPPRPPGCATPISPRRGRGRRRRSGQHPRRCDVPTVAWRARFDGAEARRGCRFRLLERQAVGADALQCGARRMTGRVPGQLCGIGVGPGDPELLTLKGLRLLQAVPVVAYPAPETGASFARGIVAQWLDRGQREIAIRFPMRPGPPPAAIYDEAAAQLAAVLDLGDDVAFLCQGDPLFYGSFAGIYTRLAPRYPVSVVPGVTSLTACAAAAGLPLAQRDTVISVIPAMLAEEVLTRRLAESDVAAIIKIGRHFAKLRRVLDRLELLRSAIYIERATLPNQRIALLSEIDLAVVPYFAMALICRDEISG